MEFKLDLISMRQVAIRCNLYYSALVPIAKYALTKSSLFARDQQHPLAHPQVRFRRVLKSALTTLVPIFSSPEMTQHLQVKLAHVVRIQRGEEGAGVKGGAGCSEPACRATCRRIELAAKACLRLGGGRGWMVVVGLGGA